MRRGLFIFAAMTALAVFGAATQWLQLVQPRTNPRMNYATCPPRELAYPNWTEPFRGYASGGETGMTVIAWMKYSSTHGSQQVIPPFVSGSCTAEACRATRDGGAGLTNLVTGSLAAGTIDVSSGSWSMECLPAGYAVPVSLSGTRWQYGCYCVNISTDTPLTLSVADTEIYIPVTNNMVRTMQGSSASRYVIVTPGSASANVQFGIAEMPLHQFVGAQCDASNGDGGLQVANPENGGLAETWRMFAFRARLDAGNMIARMDGYTSNGHLTLPQCTTQELFRARSTFEKDAMFRLNIASHSTRSLTIGTCMAKMFDGWLSDEQVERIRDLDAQELVRHGLLPSE